MNTNVDPREQRYAIFGDCWHLTADVEQAILTGLCEGKSLAKIGEGLAVDGIPMPPWRISSWSTDPRFAEFGERYRAAQKVKAAVLVEESLEISDGEGGEDTTVRVARDKLRVGTRHWIAARLDPTAFGDKGSLSLTGKDGGAIAFEEVRRTIVDQTP